MKKKLLIVSGGMEIGGIERSLLSLLGALDYETYDVDLLLFSHSGEWMNLIDKRCNLLPEISACAAMTKPIASIFMKHPLIAVCRSVLRYKVIKKHGLDDRSTFEQLASYWRSCVNFMPSVKTEYDAAISFMWPHEYTAKKVRAKKKIAWIHTDYTVAKMNFEKDEKTWSVFDRIAGVSDDVCEAFKKVYPSLAEKLITVENVLSPELVRLQAKEFKPEEIDKTKKTIVSVGRFCNAKAFDLAAETCRIMLDSGTDFKWYLIGYGGDELIRSEIKKHGVEDTLIILGKKINPYPYMAACDVYAQPSRYEGKAVTVREAQILGKPVLITDFLTAKSQVNDGVDGVICPMGPENVAAALTELLNDEEKRKTLSENCLKNDYGNTDSVDMIYKIIQR